MSGTYKIPFFGVDRQYTNLREEILRVTDEVYSSGRVLDGMYTNLFEQYMAKGCERKYAVAVGSGTQALIYAMRASEHGDPHTRHKILIPAVSFVATINSVLEAGFDPVFCDVDPHTGLIDLNKIPVEASELRAVMYVNLFGNIIDYDQLTAYRTMWAQHDITVIEDAAQSYGSYWRGVPSGKLGNLSVLSFDPTKNLNNYGSGGMVLTDDQEVRDLVVDLRDNGKRGRHTMTGTNSKMSEAECAQLIVKIRHFGDWQARRTQIANYYRDQLSHLVTIPKVDQRVEHSWHKFVIHVLNRQQVKSRLEKLGVETKIHYSVPLHIEPVSLVYAIENNLGVLQGAEEFCKTTLSLPIYPELTDAEVECVVESVIASID